MRSGSGDESMSSDLPERAQAQIQRYKGCNEPLRELGMDFLEQTIVAPIELVDGKRGSFEVSTELKRAGDVVTVVSYRNMLMMAYKPLNIELPFRRLVHKLKKDGRLLMSDSPQEMFLQKDAYDKAHGKVLTSGLGIGMFTMMAAKKGNVDKVTVVEIEPDVIDLVPITHPKVEIINDDIWSYLRTTDETFDFIYIDIHYATGAMEYGQTVLPMKVILNKRFLDADVYFWGEEEMKSQWVPDCEHCYYGKRNTPNICAICKEECGD